MCPMKNNKNSNRYTNDFKEMIVDLYHSGQKVKDLSSEYGVSEVSIYAWIKLNKSGNTFMSSLSA